MQPTVTVERKGVAAVVHLRGDLAMRDARALWGSLRQTARRRDVRRIVVDFGEAGRIDSSAIAAVALLREQLARAGKELELARLDDRQRAAFELVPQPSEPPPLPEVPGVLERIGGRIDTTATSARDLGRLVADSTRQGVAVVAGTRHLPRGALIDQIARMGVDAVFVVGLLSCLLGLTTAFQGSVQLQRFGAGPFVADMVGLTMVRELAPLMTAIILTGRTGAAIAAELGTMKVGSEIDALRAMGISPVRYLVVPRLAAITIVVPALTLMAMFIGILGGMLVASQTLHMPATAFWARVVERVDVWDFVHGLGKSVVFGAIIGLTGCHRGLRAGKDAQSVGHATTRTVVTSIFFIIVVDAIFATIATTTRYS
jgi:phospholipid/cholesterol/gamma-HCH transport system permease protein